MIGQYDNVCSYEMGKTRRTQTGAASLLPAYPGSMDHYEEKGCWQKTKQGQ